MLHQLYRGRERVAQASFLNQVPAVPHIIRRHTSHCLADIPVQSVIVEGTGGAIVGHARQSVLRVVDVAGDAGLLTITFVQSMKPRKS